LLKSACDITPSGPFQELKCAIFEVHEKQLPSLAHAVALRLVTPGTINMLKLFLFI
jgi:hypothetical protein